MDTAQSAIRTYFGKLGLEPELAAIYLALHAHGPQTISALSRNSKVERTRIYRLIDRLMESNLIEIEPQSKRGIIKAAPIANLRILINQRQAELANLQDELGLIEQALARNALSGPGTRVQMYHGAEGIRQMRLNVLGATTDILTSATHELAAVVGSSFAKQWVDQFEARQLHGRLLINDSGGNEPPAGQQPGAATLRQPKGLVCATVATSTFRLRQYCDIYNNVVAYYYQHGGEGYGLELYHEGIAASQRQAFELLWQQLSGPVSPPAGAMR